MIGETNIEEKNKVEEEERPRLVKSKYGFLPTSFWIIGSKPQSLDTFISDSIGKGSYSGITSHTKSARWKAKADKEKQGIKTKLSQVHPEVARRVIMLWSKAGDTMYDPFCERIPRILVANSLKRHAIGTDISKLFQSHNIDLLKKKFEANISNSVLIKGMDLENLKFEGTLNGYNVSLYRCDSRNVPFIKDESVDLIFTSPPYFVIEYYGEEENQLGYGKAIHGDNPDYNKFLQELKKVIQENYRVLKKGKFSAWMVGDIRKQGKFYTFAADCVNLFKEVGFEPWDWIVYNQHTPSIIGVGKAIDRMYTVKAHEHILVFRKPEEENIFA